MNDNFDFPKAPQNEAFMTDKEMKSHKKIFSQIGFAFLSYLLVSQIMADLAGYLIAYFAPQLFLSQDFLLILSSIIQYLVAFPVLFICLRSIPKSEPLSNGRIGTKKSLKYLVVCMLFIYVGNYISNFLMAKIENILGKMPENTTNIILDNTNIWVSVLIVGLIGPIFEELIFRKLFIDRLTPYGDVIAILLPSLVFGLFHGNLYQFFYAFLLGVVFSYIYLKTGNLSYTILLHMFVNLFCGVLPTYIFSVLDYNQLIELVSTGAITEEYIMANALPIFLFLLYSYGMLAMVGVGIFVFFRNIKKLTLNKGKIRFPKGATLDVMFFNLGTIALIAFSIYLIASNTFG